MTVSTHLKAAIAGGNTRAVCGDRKRAVLKLIMEHGPLPSYKLRELVQPPIQRIKLRNVLRRMKREGLLAVHYHPLFGKCGIHYRIPRTKRAKRGVAKILSLSEDAIQPFVTKQDLLHSAECATWCEWFKLTFPGTEAVRYERWISYSDRTRALLQEVKDAMLRPDLLLILKREAEPREILIGVKIEPLHYCSRDILKPLRRIAASSFDRMLYICGVSEEVGEYLNRICRSKFLRDASDKRGGPKHYLLIGTREFDAKTLEPKMFGVNGEPVSLQTWMQEIQTSTTFQPQNSSLQQVGDRGGHFVFQET